jgi:hypothetical protein
MYQREIFYGESFLKLAWHRWVGEAKHAIIHQAA